MECFDFSVGWVLKTEGGCVHVCMCVCVCVVDYSLPLSPHCPMRSFSIFLMGWGGGGGGDVTQRCLMLTMKRKYAVI